MVVVLDREVSIVRDGSVRGVLTDADLLGDVGVSPPQLVAAFQRAGLADPPLTVTEAAERLQE